LSAITFPKAPHGVPIGCIPFGPKSRKVADLVASRTKIPRLGDQLDLRNDGILLNDVEKRAQAIDVVELTRQRRRQIETKPVDVHFSDPVAQAIGD